MAEILGYTHVSLIPGEHKQRCEAEYRFLFLDHPRECLHEWPLAFEALTAFSHGCAPSVNVSIIIDDWH